LWRRGHLEEARALVVDLSEDVRDAGMASIVAVVATWLGDATGVDLGITFDPSFEETDDEQALAWWHYRRMEAAVRAGEFDVAVDLAERSMAEVLTSGIDDDLAHVWPGMVATALAAGDLAAAERLIQPGASAPPMLLTPVLAAQLPSHRGLVAASRGDEPDAVEADLRAGIAGLEDFGAVGLAARAKEDLARWLASLGRADEAALLTAQSRSTYREIGAQGWLAAADARLSGVPDGGGAAGTASPRLGAAALLLG
jgi:hypothetical protein